VPVREISET
jgi:hypothetical protein